MKRLRLLTLLAAALLCAVAIAQTTPQTNVNKEVGQTATLSWQAPTTYVGGAAIASGTAITYNVYEGAQVNGSCTLGTSPVQVGITTLSYTTPAFASTGVFCYAPTAVVAGVESAKGGTVTATVTNPVPNSPAGTSIQ